MGWMDRWAAREQRVSDKQLERSREHYERVRRRGPVTLMDRWIAREQRVTEQQNEHFQAVSKVKPLVPDEPVQGPVGPPVKVEVCPAGTYWLGIFGGRMAGGIGVGGPAALLGLTWLGAGAVSALTSFLLWRYAFHKAYTVHFRTIEYDLPATRGSVRLPTEPEACRYAAELVSRIRSEGFQDPDSLLADTGNAAP